MSTIINATTTNGVVIKPDNSGSLQLATNSGTTAVTISTAQNVGIGTTSPSAKLSVTAGSSNLDLGLLATVSSKIEQTTGDLRIRVSSSNSDNYLDSNRNIIFGTGASYTERMRIDSSGNVLINATSAISASSFLNIKGVANARSCATLAVGENGNGAVDFFNASNAYVASIVVNSSSVAYNTTSDYRLKENVAPMTGALDTVAQLKPVTYTWKADGSNAQGFIAHELQAVVPDCVTGEKDAVDEDGNPKYQGVDTSFLVATLTAAIQEQQTIINDLKARIETLEAK